MKAVLVLDMPMDCQFCKMAHWSKADVLMGCDAVVGKKYGDAEFWNDGRPSWCPLKPLPHKLQADWYTDGYKEGFNACLEEITGETE